MVAEEVEERGGRRGQSEERFQRYENGGCAPARSLEEEPHRVSLKQRGHGGSVVGRKGDVSTVEGEIGTGVVEHDAVLQRVPSTPHGVLGPVGSRNLGLLGCNLSRRISRKIIILPNLR
jgi:hypothetical protein